MTWEDELDEKGRADWDRFVRQVREGTVRGIAESAFVMTVAPGGEPDIKLAVETGLAVLMDKPIVVVAMEGREVPPGLRRVAHAVIEAGDIDTEAGAADLREKLGPILRDLKADG